MVNLKAIEFKGVYFTERICDVQEILLVFDDEVYYDIKIRERDVSGKKYRFVNGEMLKKDGRFK